MRSRLAWIAVAIAVAVLSSPSFAPRTILAQEAIPLSTEASRFAESIALVDLSGDVVEAGPVDNDYERTNGVLPKSQNPTTDGDADGAITPAAPGPPAPAPAPSTSVDGLSNGDNATAFGFRLSPPDADGEVGPNHFVQYVNLLFRVYSKTGAPLTAPIKLSTLFAPLGGLCAGPDRGDPIVLYDQLADRWLISQFAFVGSGTEPPYHECIAISKTADPAGVYYLYDFLVPTTEFNDYPHIGVWPDGYYMTANQFFRGVSFDGAGAFAFNRMKMLAGNPTANMIYFNLNLASHPEGIGGTLPSDLDGLAPPPPGAPNVFAHFTANEFGDPIDGLRLYDFHADFVVPANSTFTKRQADLPVPSFDPRAPSGRADIEQPPSGIPTSPSVPVDAIQDRLMFRLAYRNFGDHESLVVNHTINVTPVPGTVTLANHQAGVRFYELQRTSPSGPFAVNVAQTIAPDTANRWMGSAAQDHDGNIAVGYSVSSTTVFPSIRYSGRLADGTQRTETSLVSGSGVQRSTGSRWGDYSALSVDPVDDCTFYYTQEYYTAASQATSTVGWLTRIGSFKFPECAAAPRATMIGTVVNATNNAPIAGALVDLGDGHVTSTDSLGVYTMYLLPGTYSGTASSVNYMPSTTAGIVLADNATTTVNFALTPFGTDVAIATGGPTTAEGGTDLVYVLTVSNHGPLAAANVVVSETTPAGTIFVSATPSQGACGTTPPQGGTGAIACNLGSLNTSATATVTIALHSTDGAGSVVNFASVASATPDAAIYNNTSIFTTLLTCGGDITITAGPIGTAAVHGTQTGRLNRSGSPTVCGFPKASPGLAASTGTRKYDAYQFTNEGTSSACVRIEVTAGPNCAVPVVGNPNTNPLFAVVYNGGFDPAHLETNYLADLGSSPNATTTPVTLAMSADIPAGATVTLVVHEVNPQPAPSCGGYSLRVIGLPKACALSNLTLTKSGTPATVVANGNLTYSIEGANAGPQAASFANFTDAVPANTRFQSMATPAGWMCTTPAAGDTGTINCTKPSMASGETVTFSPVVQANCPVPNGTAVTNSASLTSSTNDPNPFNNTATASNTISNPGPTITGLSVNKPALWPPNHKMVDVTLNYGIAPVCGTATTSVAITSNEPVDGTGDGDTSPDWAIVDAHHVQLRAERAGGGSGRVYTITVTSTDGAGNTTSSSTTVRVPHDRSS